MVSTGEVDEEIEAIQRVLGACERVRITRGPLAGIEGILAQVKPNKGVLVLSVELLQRSVAVAVDCTLVVAA